MSKSGSQSCESAEARVATYPWRLRTANFELRCCKVVLDRARILGLLEVLLDRDELHGDVQKPGSVLVVNLVKNTAGQFDT
jgi:hypothetical protein